MIEGEDRRAPPGALAAWLAQGARSAFGLAPRWQGLRATPWMAGCLVVLAWLCTVAIERLYIEGPATFYWRAIEFGWLGTLASLWLCWLLVPRARPDAAAAQAPSAGALFMMLVSQTVVLLVLHAVVLVPLVRSGRFHEAAPGTWGVWLAWWLPLAWQIGAGLGLIARESMSGRARRAIAAFAFVLPFGFWVWGEPVRHWEALVAQRGEAGDEAFVLTQEATERQPQLLAEKLQALRAQRPGVADLYALTFAPYAEEKVFLREGQLVAGVMQERFDAEGRVVQLANHPDSASERPWATPLNLQRAIERVAALMDRDEDIFFIHLTSHGARDGELAASAYPLAAAPVTPALLKAWLDAAGVRFRVISVSACYSGSWIAPLAGADTLVMTAADAEHTSYGCGRGSELTYFGRAMFDEQLRRTRSFAQAHARSRVVIDERERVAGKSDGYSNPQISIGAGVRERLAALEARLAAAH